MEGKKGLFNRQPASCTGDRLRLSANAAGTVTGPVEISQYNLLSDWNGRRNVPSTRSAYKQRRHRTNRYTLFQLLCCLFHPTSQCIAMYACVGQQSSTSTAPVRLGQQCPLTTLAPINIPVAKSPLRGLVLSTNHYCPSIDAASGPPVHFQTLQHRRQNLRALEVAYRQVPRRRNGHAQPGPSIMRRQYWTR